MVDYFMRYLLLIALVVNSLFCFADTIYRYQDEQGRWHFTDKKPSKNEATELKFAQAAKTNEPALNARVVDGTWTLFANNPLLSPIEMAVQIDEKRGLRKIIPAASEIQIADNIDPNERYPFHYFLGDPVQKADNSDYFLPIERKIGHFVSQGFDGRFSHNQEPNRYAVDIALPVGTEIYAARKGVVVKAQDNFVLDGQEMYFADKANMVMVLHEDGTIGVYAHLLAGGVKVQIGQTVEVGDLLALSGSTGFSSGPHLHFVVWRNVGLRYQSVPFRFKEQNHFGSWLPTAKMPLEP
jgi:murein DD-endopeptidase MepM/ murein hydrolase activator NlpD